MPINRTPFNALVDDDGSGTVGTVWNKAQIQNVLLDPIDAMRATVVLNSETGTFPGWAPGLLGQATIVLWAGTGPLIVQGIAAGTPGQIVTIRNGGGQVAFFEHFNSTAAAANFSLSNCLTAGLTPVATGGWITYQYIESNWQMVGHEQGAWITPPFNAAQFTADGGWTVAAFDVSVHAYRISGKTLEYHLQLLGPTVNGSPASLTVLNPGGITTFPGVQPFLPALLYISGGGWTAGGVVQPGATGLSLYTAGLGGWTPGQKNLCLGVTIQAT